MNKFFKCKIAILFQTLSNITYTCAGWAGNWVRGNTSAGPPWSGQKIGAFLWRELQNDNWRWNQSHDTTLRTAPGRGEQLNSFPNMEQHVFCPANFLTEAVVVSVAQLPPRPRILPHNNSPGAGLGWAGWAGRAGLVTEKQQNARVEAEGGWMEWYSEGWET